MHRCLHIYTVQQCNSRINNTHTPIATLFLSHISVLLLTSDTHTQTHTISHTHIQNRHTHTHTHTVTARNMQPQSTQWHHTLLYKTQHTSTKTHAFQCSPSPLRKKACVRTHTDTHTHTHIHTHTHR